jgi:hypothetical protein
LLLADRECVDLKWMLMMMGEKNAVDDRVDHSE